MKKRIMLTTLLVVVVASSTITYGQHKRDETITAMMEICDRLSMKGLWTEAIDIRRQLLSQGPSDKIQVILLNKIGGDLRYKEEYDQAQRVLEKSLQLAVKKKLYVERAEALYLLGDIAYVKWAYFRSDSVDRAKQLVNEALGIYESVKDNAGVSQCRYRLGTILQIQGDESQSMKTIQRSIHLSKQANDTLGLTRSLTHLAAGYGDKGMLDSALYYHQQALMLADAQGNNYGRAHYLNNVGEILMLLNRNDEALENFRKALFISQALNQNLILCRSYYSLADLSKKNGDRVKTKEYLSSGLTFARRAGYKNFINEFESLNKSF